MVEIKSELMSVEATVRKVDEKVRQTIDMIAETRFGERPNAVARLVLLPDTTTERRRVARSERVLTVALPARGNVLRRCLRRPDGPIRGILFVAGTNPGSERHRRSAERCHAAALSTDDPAWFVSGSGSAVTAVRRCPVLPGLVDGPGRGARRGPDSVAQTSSAISAAARAAPSDSTGLPVPGRSISSAMAAPITSGSDSSNSMNRPAP